MENTIVKNFFSCAWVHRCGKTSWLFEPDSRHNNTLSHTTRNGTTYLIEEGVSAGKPFWIGELTKDGKIVFTVEKSLRATEIEFGNGGRYIFPKK